MSMVQDKEMERLVLEMARTFNWISLYQSGHSTLSDRVDRFHRELSARLAQEPSGQLLLGIAKDKLLYRNAFLGNGHSLIRNFTEILYLQQVATLAFSADVSPDGLLSFFLCLRRVRTDEKEARLEDLLKREGVRGVNIYPYNYKEVLSRRIVGIGGAKSSSEREDELWRMLLTENVSSGAGDAQGSLGISIPPEMVASILFKARSASVRGNGGENAPQDPLEGLLPPELVQKVFTRLGEAFRKLPADRKMEILLSLEGDGGSREVAEAGNGSEVDDDLVRALADSHTEEEFLDLLAEVLSVEGKGGPRLRKIFGTITSDRNAAGSLLPKVRMRLGDSLRTKNYFARKTWEAVETLLLARTEDAYLGQDHSRLLEDLSFDGDASPCAGRGGRTADAALRADFGERSLRRKAAGVLLELLTDEENEGDFLGLLEEVRKGIPNLISRKDFFLLQRILSVLALLIGAGPESRKSAIRNVLGELDFAYMLDLYLSPALAGEERALVEQILVSSADLSMGDYLDRLLMEPEAGKRRTLLSLSSRFDRKGLPGIRERLSDPHWYFVRNLCFMLGEMGDVGTAPDLVNLLEHEDHRVRREAIQAIGKLKAVEAASSLGKILTQDSRLGSAKEESLQIEAANALFRCGGTRAAFYLHRGAESGRQKVRAHCTTLLEAMEARR